MMLYCSVAKLPIIHKNLDNNKDGKVKIRWKFAGYNALVPTNTVRLKVVVERAPRKVAVLLTNDN